ncbi:tyrosine-protein phosphatase [Microtetraspora niveoalba]|uniref:tyrosine-protein phosphatase n=1 Tax=Microtetraspora niveoalba TaxID=46175 RepID=UPI00083484F5|nr:tyrosine-protein phosphatase [Microtetraspora niveoalba]
MYSRLSARTASCLLALAVLPLTPVSPAAPVQAAAATQDAQQATRPLSLLQGAVNVRDLGGHRTRSGEKVRPGLVYRADSLQKLTDADLTAVAGLGVSRVIDFRTPLEVETDGADRLPAGLPVTSRPVDDAGLNAATRGAIATGDPRRQQELLGGGRAEELMRTVYRSFVTDPKSRAQFAATLRDLAERPAAPLLFHCTSGKDRTGWLSYLLLIELGVPEGTARRDFLLSNDYRREADAKTRAGLKASGMMEDPDLMIPIQEVRDDYLDAALDQVRRDYGSLTAYVRVGLGVKGGTLAQLRKNLLTR